MTSAVTTTDRNEQRNPKPLTAKEAIAANVQVLIKQLEAGHSDALTAFLDAMKRRREEAMSNAICIRVLAAITAAVPVRLMKRDLVFLAERLAALLDDHRLAVVAKQHGIKPGKEGDAIGKLFATWLRRAEEGELGKVLVELTIVLSAARANAPQVLRDAATLYKVNTDAISLKVKQEFAAKDKSRTAKKPPVKAQSKSVKKVAA